MADHTKLIPHILKWEGGFSNDPDDRGGATNKGITLSTYTVWCRKHGYPKPTVERLKAIDRKTWERIYKELFWDRCQGDRIKSQAVANMLVDWYWTSGAWAVKKLQGIIGVTADGILGERTLTALNAYDPEELWHKLYQAREQFYTNNGHPKFRRGWINRLRATPK